MSLAARRSTRLREDFVIRLGCLLVSFAVLASLVLEPPRAKAFALTSSAVTALAGGFLNACGLVPVVSGMSSSGEVNESLARLIQDFLDEEHPGLKDAVDWIGDAVLTVNGGRVIIPSETAKRLSAFATWVAGKYGTKPGMNQIYHTFGDYATLQDGSKFYLSVLDGNKVVSPGTNFSIEDSPIVFSSGYYFTISKNPDYGDYYCFDLFSPQGESISHVTRGYGPSFLPVCFSIVGSASRPMFSFSFFISSWCSPFELANLIEYPILDVVSMDESLSLDVSDTMQQVLDRLTALEEGQSIALDVGATQSMEIQEILQGILDAILAGDLAASAEIVDTAEVPVEPEEPDPPVVPVVPSGLDKLGAALTSRFPFSIPWDVYKGVTLLAAPPKAPYFEVDFMAPIADRVGGWQGSTKIVLDMSEYEIIGQVCRWTSTIGFCLMLATGTKRLIWTA